MNRTRLIACVSLSALCALLTACGPGVPDPSTPPTSFQAEVSSEQVEPAPTVPADGGFGPWQLTDETQTSTVTFDRDGTSSAATEAATCVTAMNAPAVIWVVVTVENKSGENLTPNGVTIVAADGAQIDATNAIETLNDAYGEAPESDARAACVSTNQTLADSQLENGVSGGATVVALLSIPADVTGIKSVTLNGYGATGALTYAE